MTSSRVPITRPGRPIPGNSAKLFVFAWISSANDFARSALSFSMYSTMAARLASAVLVHLTAIFCEERIYFAVTGELAAICFRDALLDVLDLPSLGLNIIPERSDGDCAIVPTGGLNELFELTGQVRWKADRHRFVGAWFHDFHWNEVKM